MYEDLEKYLSKLANNLIMFTTILQNLSTKDLKFLAFMVSVELDLRELESLEDKKC